MAEDVRVTGAEAEPAGEAIHLPGPSYLPVIAAAGVTIVVVGVVQSWVIVVIGALTAIVAIGRWLSQTRQEMSELPLER